MEYRPEKKEIHGPAECKFSFEIIQNLRKIKTAFYVRDKRQVMLNTWVCHFTYQAAVDNIYFYLILFSEYN